MVSCSLSSEKEDLIRIHDIQYRHLLEELELKLWQERILSSRSSPYIALCNACVGYVESSEKRMADGAYPDLTDMYIYRYYYEKLTERILSHSKIIQTHRVYYHKSFPFFSENNSREEYKIQLQQSNLYLLMNLLHYTKLEGVQYPYGRQGKEEYPEPLLISIDTEGDSLEFHFLYGRFLRPFLKKEYTETTIQDAAGRVYPVRNVHQNEQFIPVLYTTPGIVAPILFTKSSIQSPNGNYLYKYDEEYR